jgi:chemotaxis protein MotB
MAGKGEGTTIIKKKKVVGGGGHHGGAWKVAYADFVTAMMAFFLLMWLLNATTEEQRKGIADYFKPSIPIHRTSGGGDGPFMGDSAVSQQSMTTVGTGANAEGSRSAPEEEDAEADDDGANAAEKAELARLQRELEGRTGESDVEDPLLEHIVSRVTDEGLVIEIFDLPESPLFFENTDQPTPMAEALLTLIAEVSQSVTNPIAVRGHLNSRPISEQSYDNWILSSSRALRSREILARGGLLPDRFQQVTGKADRVLAQPDPFDVRNRRIEIVLLRSPRPASRE